MKAHKQDRHDTSNTTHAAPFNFDGWMEFDASRWEVQEQFPVTLTLNPLREADEGEILKALEGLDS